MQKETITSRNTPRSSGGGGTIAVSVAAIASVLAASSCCLPLLPFVVAAGLAGSSGFLWEARPYLLAGSILLIGYGFYQARCARKCNRRPNAIASVLLWASAIFIFISVFFPQVFANAMASLMGR